MGPPASSGIEECLSARPPLLDPLTPSDYLVIEVPLKGPERRAFAFFAWRFSVHELLAAVFEFFLPPNKSSWGRMEGACAWATAGGGERCVWRRARAEGLKRQSVPAGTPEGGHSVRTARLPPCACSPVDGRTLGELLTPSGNPGAPSGVDPETVRRPELCPPSSGGAHASSLRRLEPSAGSGFARPRPRMPRRAVSVKRCPCRVHRLGARSDRRWSLKPRQ